MAICATLPAPTWTTAFGGNLAITPDGYIIAQDIACQYELIEAHPCDRCQGRLLPIAQLKKEELHQLLAPIALYPDKLVAQVLMASTYPLEVIEAEQRYWQLPLSREQRLARLRRAAAGTRLWVSFAAWCRPAATSA